MDNIFNGVENEMPDCKDISPQSGLDCADRKTPGKEQAGGGLSLGFQRPLRQHSQHTDGGEQDQQGGHFFLSLFSIIVAIQMVSSPTPQQAIQSAKQNRAVSIVSAIGCLHVVLFHYRPAALF